MSVWSGFSPLPMAKVADTSSQVAAQRVAFRMASASLALCLLGSVALTVVFLWHGGTDTPWVLAWTVLPVTLSVLGVAFSRSHRNGPMWMITGAMAGFALLAIMSMGPFYACGVLLMLVASVVHVRAARPGWRVNLIPVWFLAGVTSLSLVFLLFDFVYNNERHRVVHGPGIAWAGWLFAGLCAVLVAAESSAEHSGRVVRQRP